MASNRSGRRRILVLVGMMAIAALVVIGTDVFGASHDDTSPVNLSTPVDMADGMAHLSAIVRSGEARIEVLSPTLLRLEYSPSGNFENSPTVNAIDRRMPVPRYNARVSARLAHGPDQPGHAPLQGRIRALHRGQHLVALRRRPGRCPPCIPPGTGSAPSTRPARRAPRLSVEGRPSARPRAGTRAAPGTWATFHQGASATWSVLGAPAGTTTLLSIRYSNVVRTGSTPAPRTIDLMVDGHLLTTLRAPPTDSAQPWSTLTTTASLKAGSNSVAMRCDAGNSCGIDLDTLSTRPAGHLTSTAVQTDPLGGWVRGFDTFTYEPVQPCAPGTGGATCQNTFEPLHTDGLLDRGRLAVAGRHPERAVDTTGMGPAPATRRGRRGRLPVRLRPRLLRRLAYLRPVDRSRSAAPPPVFGVWYSDYTPYSSRYHRGLALSRLSEGRSPTQHAVARHRLEGAQQLGRMGVEQHTLSPSERLPAMGPIAKRIDVTLNIHSSIAVDDPKLPTAQSIAGTTLAKISCTAGICKVWDWSSVPQAESNFALQQSFQQQGVAFWWLDWCCDESTVSMPGLTPDSWIGHLYAQEMVNQGQRGFVLARIGSSNGNPQEVYPAGPWSDHTSAIAFTGDAWGTWNTLAQEVALTPDEATIGEPYVSDDIGSFLGPPPQGTQDPPDLYDRWVQFGTFQPILRLHSNNEQRLPWQYPQPVRAITEDIPPPA